jgi:hypothetical protein
MRERVRLLRHLQVFPSTNWRQSVAETRGSPLSAPPKSPRPGRVLAERRTGQDRRGGERRSGVTTRRILVRWTDRDRRSGADRRKNAAVRVKDATHERTQPA